MTTLPIERDTILVRLNGIQEELSELQKLAKTAKKDFVLGNGHKLASYHLHRILEGVFNIANHLLSRLPGGAAFSYKDMALLLGKRGIVSKKFAEGALVKMAGYRNRLVHFYAEVTPEELFTIVTKHLGDVDTYCKAVRAVLEAPDKWGLKMT